ncbi:NAD dependent epimerase/dehydratase [Colletotrichum musicola]|uniref:NAD dependent epimerase/dehydratase n=1 Tax=Colletotrichum musicola TaxID=2175873 RepID=A0A8H6U9D7_9PEZI|nr:NAD dependent epimerase/dehydratase [Colletotrichum musicola]
MDFLTSPDQLADKLKKHNIRADYVFFFAYIQPKPEVEGPIWSAVDELEESDPRVLLKPNVFYHQEDSLKEFARENGFNWITTRPSWIPGAAQDAAMNLCLPLGIYAIVQKSMGRALEYPADLTAWETQQAIVERPDERVLVGMEEWKKLASDHGLRIRDLWDVDRVFGFVDAGLQQSWPNNYSSSKAKKLGFLGFVDSNEAMLRVVDVYADLKMFPRNS